MLEESENNGGENHSCSVGATRPESAGRLQTQKEEHNSDNTPDLTNTEFNTRKMVTMVRERTMDSQDFYKRVNCLPLKIRQMTFISEDYESGNNAMNVDMRRHSKANSLGKGDYWNKDIVRQVDSWMKSRPILDGHNVTPRAQFTPPQSHENLRKRRQKRHRLRGSEDAQTETGESLNSLADSIVSVSSEKSQVPRSLNFESSNTLPKQFLNQNFKHKYGKYNRSFENHTENHEQDKVKNSHGSAYNEIEFQKRYRRINDLKSHLQFVNTTCLSGQNILKKNNRLPPMEQQYDSDRESTLAAISSVQKHNEPDSQSVDQQSTDSVVSSVYATSTLVTTHISPFQERDNPEMRAKTPWVLVNNKLDVKQYAKLHKIKPKSPKPLKLPNILPSRKMLKKKVNNRYQLSVSEYQVISETDIPGLDDGSASQSKVKDSQVSPHHAKVEHGEGNECNNSEEDDDDQSDFGLREMKISIHIKYKKNKKNEPEVPWYAHQADGRIRTEYLKTNEETKISKEMRRVSE